MAGQFCKTQQERPHSSVEHTREETVSSAARSSSSQAGWGAQQPSQHWDSRARSQTPFQIKRDSLVRSSRQGRIMGAVKNTHTSKALPLPRDTTSLLLLSSSGAPLQTVPGCLYGHSTCSAARESWELAEVPWCCQDRPPVTGGAPGAAAQSNSGAFLAALVTTLVLTYSGCLAKLMTQTFLHGGQISWLIKQ